MGKAYRVVGPVAVIRKNKHERYVNRGGIFLADALDEENAEHLLGVGLIEAFDLPDAAPAAAVLTAVTPDAVVVPAGTEGVEVPEGAPAKAWTHPQIDKWASLQSPPILLEADASKDAKLEAIAKLQAAPQS